MHASHFMVCMTAALWYACQHFTLCIPANWQCTCQLLHNVGASCIIMCMPATSQHACQPLNYEHSNYFTAWRPANSCCAQNCPPGPSKPLHALHARQFTPCMQPPHNVHASYFKMCMPATSHPACQPPHNLHTSHFTMWSVATSQHHASHFTYVC